MQCEKATRLSNGTKDFLNELCSFFCVPKGTEIFVFKNVTNQTKNITQQESLQMKYFKAH